ncbi:2-C-methyl-D-erythritol 4-phosphate cytidylyltransferase [Clostridium aciditolerans]|uniref:2-C-methyl-D-erythritol 4-phosphate cytidylyltransferase n=1 Tax=Clostridium aciditolerans TaxID=339861 RepID=A0A934HU20_9CLOT|nr:2-C-methyl-D-erythritol 4-phosphate cytidylyltransferase [Clostridium aciditolerans]MBI6874295.1 2-C-methyl-D-erythritol 4-phosphate cytidylyltransferase [Clostridium aciditolerans]
MGKNCAIIVAAGKGRRMGANINKQFLDIKNKPVIYYSLAAFSNNKSIDEIVIVCAEDEIDYCKIEIVEKYKIDKVSRIVAGGKERQDSVYNGLRAIEDCEIVLIHDGARPFVNDKIIEDGIRCAKQYDACACGVVPKDTIKIRDTQGISVDTLDRNRLFSVQTPQCFKYNMILECHKKLSKDSISVTDDTAVANYYGNKVYLYEGSYDNIKITTPEDLYVAEGILKRIKKED